MVKIKLTKNTFKNFSRDVNSIISSEKKKRTTREKARTIRVGEHSNSSLFRKIYCTRVNEGEKND